MDRNKIVKKYESVILISAKIVSFKKWNFSYLYKNVDTSIQVLGTFTSSLFHCNFLNVQFKYQMQT